MRRVRRSVTGVVRPVAAAAAVLVLAAACAAPGGRGAPATAPDEGLLEFVRCMRRHGISLADPVVTGRDRVEIRPAPGAPPAPRDEFDAATEACEREGHRPFGAAGERQGLDRAAQDRALAFARCVRAEGIALPDPAFEKGTVANWDPGKLGIDLADPAVVAVGQACARRSGFDPWKEL